MPRYLRGDEEVDKSTQRGVAMGFLGLEPVGGLPHHHFSFLRSRWVIGYPRNINNTGVLSWDQAAGEVDGQWNDQSPGQSWSCFQNTTFCTDIYMF